tara:strand:- start:815 stop:1135 length:321 start_codon:yes stop_codon:yes gene_type:complete
MNSLDDRKKGFEAKYLKDQELEFKIRSLRNKFVGEWAASIINPENVEAYIKEVRISDLEKPGDDDLIEKLLEDFKLNNLSIDKNEIIKKIEESEMNAIKEFQKSDK